MSLFNKFVGGKSAPARREPNPAIENAPCLILINQKPNDLNADVILQKLRSFDPETKNAWFELTGEAEGAMIAHAGWGEHVFRIVGFNAPMPADSLEASLQPAPFADEMKQAPRQHVAHILVFYVGYIANVFEQYVATGLMTAALCNENTSIVLNENARTALPAQIFTDGQVMQTMGMMNFLRSMPLLMLFCGIVRYVTESGGIWMRTFGCDMLGLPDLAVYITDFSRSSEMMDLFGSVLAYIMESGHEVNPGDTMQLEEELFMRLREPTEEEFYLESKGMMLVTEFIRPDQINPNVRGAGKGS